MVFDDRRRAESFGAVGELYDRSRPTYPPELVDFLVAYEPARVLDVGCGTGIAAALFAARGCAVVGVEVDERMAAIARAKGLEVEVSRFEDWDPAGRTFDLVTAAQSWHWVEPQAGAAKAASVLGPGGRIGVFWNVGHPPQRVRERLDPVYERLEPGLRSHSVVLGHAEPHAVAGPHLSALTDSIEFGPTATEVFPWTMTYDAASWSERLETSSDHRILSPERRERLLEAVRTAIGSIGGSFEMHYDTVLVTATRK